jgi:phenylalanyl-tRNA synthetase beta subunit
LKSISHNKKNKVPFKFFEIGDVMFLENKGNKDEITGCKNERRMAVIYNNATTSGLEIVHGVLDLVFKKLFKGKKDYELKSGS